MDVRAFGSRKSGKKKLYFPAFRAMGWKFWGRDVHPENHPEVHGISPPSTLCCGVFNVHKAELEVTDLRWRNPICSFLRFSTKICGFMRFPVPSKCLNFQEKGRICENLRFSAKICVVGSLCPPLVPSPQARLSLCVVCNSLFNFIGCFSLPVLGCSLRLVPRRSSKRSVDLATEGQVETRLAASRAALTLVLGRSYCLQWNRTW